MLTLSRSTSGKFGYGIGRIYVWALLRIHLGLFLSHMVSYYGNVNGATMRSTTLHYNKAKLTWNSAYHTCSFHGHLVNINNHTMQHAVTKSLQNAGKDLWIGLHDQGGLNDDDWRWSDCQPLENDWKYWDTDEPKDTDKRYCTFATDSTYHWRLKECTSGELPSLCAETQGECHYEDHSDTECGAVAVKLNMNTEGRNECQALCDQMTHRGDVWAYEYRENDECKLIFDQSPFACDQTITRAGSSLSIRRCFVFETINDAKQLEDDKSPNPVLRCEIASSNTALATAASATAIAKTSATATASATTIIMVTAITPNVSDASTSIVPESAAISVSRVSSDLTTDLDLTFWSSPLTVTSTSQSGQVQVTESNREWFSHFEDVSQFIMISNHVSQENIAMAKVDMSGGITTNARISIHTTSSKAFENTMDSATFLLEQEATSHEKIQLQMTSSAVSKIEVSDRFDSTNQGFYTVSVLSPPINSLLGSQSSLEVLLATPTSNSQETQSTFRHLEDSSEFLDREMTNVFTETVSASQFPTSAINHTICLCHCSKNGQTDTTHSLPELMLDKRNLSLYRRRLDSATDDRPSARSLGVFGLVVIVMSAVFIVLLDVNRLFGHR